MPETVTVRLRLRLLGPPQIVDDADPGWRFLPKRKSLELLAYLVLHAESQLGRDTVAFALWPDANEEDARANLRRNLHVLVPLLPAAATWILVQPETLQWNVEAPAWCDVAAFRAAVERRDFAEAARLYRGELLAGFYDEWILEERERLVRAHHDALTQLVREHRTRRDFAAAAGYAQQLLDSDPWREDAVRHLIAIRYEAGDRAAALRCYDSFAERLRAEMNVEPMPETQALRDAILHSRSTGDVRGAAATIASVAPSQAEPAWTLPFVGRERELDTLRAWWNRAATGAGAAVFVGGEAGIGKSSLVRAFAAQVGDEGGRVLYGGTSSPERFPYQAVLDALAGASSLIAASGVESTWLRELGELLPELKMLLTAAEARRAPPSELDPERRRMRLFEAMARVIERLAESRPLVLVMEDVHWAGPATLELLGYLVSRLAESHVLIVATYRADELASGHELTALRRDLIPRSRAANVQLGALSREEVQVVVQSVWRSDGAAPSGIQWHERSAGNPLFLSELLRDAIEAGSTDALPAHIKDAIAARLDRLSDTARATINLASVVGEAVDFEVIGAASGWDENRIADALAELLERRILRETFDRARLRYAFTHDLVRQCAYASIPPDRRLTHHRMVARALERTFSGRLDEYAFEIASHYDAGAQPTAAVPWYLRASRAALASFANAEAAEYASRGLAHADESAQAQLFLIRATARGRLGEQEREMADLQMLERLAQQRPDRALGLEVLERLIGRHIDAGRLESATAELAKMRALLAEDSGLGTALADELEARIAYEQGRYDVADALFERTSRAYRLAADARETRAAGYHAVALRRQGRFDDAAAILEHAAESLATVDDPVRRIQHFQARILVASAKQEHAASKADADEMLNLAKQIGDRRAEADARHYLAIALGKLEKFDAAEEHFAAAIAINKLIGQRTANAAVLRNYAAMQMDRYRYRRCLELTREAEELSDQTFHLAICAYNEMVALRHLDEFEAALAQGKRAAQLAVAESHAALRGAALTCIGRCLLALGQPDEARRSVDEGVGLLRGAGISAHLGIALADSIEVSLSAGTVGKAEAAAREILALRDGGTALLERASVLEAAARALQASGDTNAASGAQRDALQALEATLTALGSDSPEAMWLREQPWSRRLLISA